MTTAERHWTEQTGREAAELFKTLSTPAELRTGRY
jgi:hypothetical protein